jgi:hypothetical protein
VPDGHLLQGIPYAVEALLAQYLHEAEERCLLNGSYLRSVLPLIRFYPFLLSEADSNH